MLSLKKVIIGYKIVLKIAIFWHVFIILGQYSIEQPFAAFTVDILLG